MAVPKHKVSKARRNSRHSANTKAVMPTLVECPQWHEMKKPHTVCKNCGTYKGETVIEKKEEKKLKNHLNSLCLESFLIDKIQYSVTIRYILDTIYCVLIKFVFNIK